MTIEFIRGVLGWSALISYGILLLWFAVFALAHDWLHRLHGQWFSLSREKFDTLHYAGMAFFKLAVLVLYIAPYCALRILS